MFHLLPLHLAVSLPAKRTCFRISVLFKKFPAQNLKQKNAPSWKQQVYRPFLCSKLSSGEMAAGRAHKGHQRHSYTEMILPDTWWSSDGCGERRACFPCRLNFLQNRPNWCTRGRPAEHGLPTISVVLHWAGGVSLSLGHECWYLGGRNHSSKLWLNLKSESATDCLTPWDRSLQALCLVGMG